MPTKRLPDDGRVQNWCRSTDHLPPTMVVWKPGTYEHTCCACGKVTIFVVPEKPTLCDTHSYSDLGGYEEY